MLISNIYTTITNEIGVTLGDFNALQSTGVK